MGRKNFTPEQIIKKLIEAGIQLSQRANITESSRQIGITEQMYYRL